MKLSVDLKLPSLDDLDLTNASTLLESIVQRVAVDTRKRWASVASEKKAPREYILGAANADLIIDENITRGNTVTVRATLRNTMPNSMFVDTGHRSYHLPTAIRWPSPKTKYTKNGRMYLDVPLHKASSSIPPTLLRKAQVLHRRGKSLRGKNVPARFQGMFRGTSGWLTIRKLWMDGPLNKWIIPAKAPKKIVQQVTDEARKAMIGAMDAVLYPGE